MKTKTNCRIGKPIFKFMGILVAILVLQSCEKDGPATENENPSISVEEELQMAEKSASAENLVSEDLNLLLGIEMEADLGGKPGPCANLTWDATTNTLVIDFGTGCTGPFGKTRSGKIIVLYNGPFGVYTTDKTITFDNYMVNNVGISGVIQIGKFDQNSNGYLENSFTLVGYTHTYPNGKTLVLNGMRTREWIAGLGDNNIWNNVFRLTGGLSGVSTFGRNFTHTILEPIIADFNCRANGGFLRVDGKKELFIDGINHDWTRTVDYGDGSCDNTYTITINGNQHTITVS